MRQFLGITREALFSPGRVSDDAAILQNVADHLRVAGHSVATCSGDDARWPEATDETVVFTMSQGERALTRLQQWEAHGVRVVNSSVGVRNCQRHRTVPLLVQAGVAFPDSLLTDTAAETRLPDWIDAGRVWVKRGDVHATEADDVVAAESRTATHAALQRFRERGITRAIIQRHIHGAVVKFYAVRGRFFYCVPPVEGSEISPDVAQRIDCVGQRAAQALGVEVYGGDCVCSSDGGVTLIDLNDWPSYVRCRAAAAAAIAAHLEHK